MPSKKKKRTTANKKELAKALDCSLPTLDRLIDRFDDFPIEQKGGNGVDYVFIVEDVKAYLEKIHAAELAAAEDRLELFADLKIDRPGQATEGGITPAQRLSLVRAERETRKMKLEAGFLMDVATFKQEFAPVLGGLGQFLNGIPRRMGRRFNLPDEVILAMEDEMADELYRVVERAEKIIGGEDGLFDGDDSTDARRVVSG